MERFHIRRRVKSTTPVFLVFTTLSRIIMDSGIYPGRVIKSYRKRMEQYCHKHGVTIHKKFHDEEISKIAVIDMTIQQRPMLLTQTFCREIDVYRFLREENKHPANYRVLNFKSGKEYSLEIAEKPRVVAEFDKQLDADPVYGKNA